jgi:general secretion pathway protein J
MRANGSAGFTLIELLVAMALLALLSGLLVGGLRMSRGAVVGSEAATERLLRADAGFAVIRRQLETAEPLPLGTDFPPPIAFAGDAQSILFIAPPGAFLAPGGQQITWLGIERSADGARIVLGFRPLDRMRDSWPPVLDGAGAQTMVLIDDIASAQFSYFGRASPEEDPQWRQDWHDRTALPTLIRLSIAGGGRDWPDLVVGPRIGKPVNVGLLPGH